MGTTLRRKSFPERFRKCLRVFLTFLFSQIGLMALVIGYSLAGAYLFQWLESDREVIQRQKIQLLRIECIRQLWNLSKTEASDWDQWLTNAGHLLKDFEGQVVTATKSEGYDGKEADDVARQWSFSGALLYSITVITTIGYGNLAPKTETGKMVTCIYALLGIPLMLICLSNLGQLMAGSAQFAFNRFYCPCGGRGRPIDCTRCCRRLPVRSIREQVESGTIVLSNIVTTPVAELPKEPTPAPNDQNNRGTGLDVNDRVYHKSHADTGFISDSELTDHDYDVIGLPAVPDANKNSRCLSKGTTTAGCVNHEYHHYGLDKLDDDAKILVERCARYYDGDHHEVRASFDRGASPLPVIELDSADGAGSTLAAASMLMTAVAVPASRPVKSYHHHSAYQTGQGQLSRVPVVLVLAFLVGYVCLGAMVFSAWEEWSFLDGAYFSFITLSTIGFGDLVPGSKVLEEGQAKLATCILYLVVGLAGIAMSFNLVQEEVVNRFQQLGQNMGILDEK